MLLVGFFQWWYGAGWRDQYARISVALSRVSDYFSISLLLKTLFKPFRQISADEQARGMQGVFQVMLDKLISRAIGMIMRLFMVVAGVISLLVVALLGLVRLLVWPLFFFLPLIGIVLMFTVGTPWRI